MRRAARLVAVLTLLAVPACGVRGLNFEQDKRLTITNPKDRERVRLPITIRWRVQDFRITGRDGARRDDAGFFGVYVDRAPQPPQHTQAWLLRDDPRCRSGRTCNVSELLNETDVHSTMTTSFEIGMLPAPATNAAKRREFHAVTIVLLNGRGERIGESAFRLRFEVDRSG